MTTMTIMRPDGETEAREIDLLDDPGYHRLKDLLHPLLDGGVLEHVTVLHDGKRTDMFVDDCGLLKSLPRNEAATAIYRNNWLTQHPDEEPESLPAIHGPAILFSRRVWF